MKYMMTYVMLMKYMMKHLMKYDYISQPVDLDGFGLWSCTREFSGQRPAFGLQWDLLISTYKQMARGQRPVKTATPRQCTVFFSVIELETNKLKGDKEGPVATPRN